MQIMIYLVVFGVCLVLHDEAKYRAGDGEGVENNRFGSGNWLCH